jgi:hypothetical protein
MKNYILIEQNGATFRAGFLIQNTSLTAVKRIAAKRQIFHGKALEIRADNGALLATRCAGGRWK